MDFDLGDEQKALRDGVLEFARRELGAGEDDGFSREAWARCAAFGIQGLPVPREYGGLGTSPATVLLALEALGYGCRDNGLIFSLNAQMWGSEVPLVTFGTEEQKRRTCPRCATAR